MKRGLLLLLLLACGVAAADDKPLYRYLGPDGSVHFSDKPPNKSARPFNVTKSYSAQLLRLPNAPRFAVHFDTPTPGQRYRSDEPIDVAMSVMPGLISRFRLQLRLDGVNISAQPLQDIHVRLPNPGSGRHALLAVLLNDKGQELSRSSELQIHVKKGE